MEVSTEQPTVFIMEDLHWADPTTLELLDMIVDQGPTNRIATVLTFRPEFVSPWIGRAHLTQITVNRLTRGQVKEIVGELAGGKSLPAEVLERVVAHSDGVPLFAEELTKTVLESGVLTEADDRYNLTGELTHLAIPSTLQGSLTARLDRLSTVKQVAQLGSVIGREFTYELVQAVSTQDEAVLQRDLGSAGRGGLTLPAGYAASCELHI